MARLIKSKARKKKRVLGKPMTIKQAKETIAHLKKKKKQKVSKAFMLQLQSIINPGKKTKSR